MSAEPVIDWGVLNDPDMLDVPAPDPEQMRAERDARDAGAIARGMAIESPRVLVAYDGTPVPEPPPLPDGLVTVETLALAAKGYPEPEDRSGAVPSDQGTADYVDDLVRAGRILLMAAEEGTGKSFAAMELGARVAIAGGAVYGVWTVNVLGPVVYLSEQHADDDYRYEQDVLDSLGVPRLSLAGALYRLSIHTAAHGEPPLMVATWRAFLTSRLRRIGARVLIIDTGTAAAPVEPWGAALQRVYADLRVLLAELPDLAVVIAVHLRKPSNGKRDGGLSDVLGQWGRSADAVLMLERDGLDRTKLTLRKRVRRERRLSALRAGGLLVEPTDLDAVTPRPTDVPLDDVLSIIASDPGISLPLLASRLGKTRTTVRRYVTGLGNAVRAEQGSVKGATRYWPVSKGGVEGFDTFDTLRRERGVEGVSNPYGEGFDTPRVLPIGEEDARVEGGVKPVALDQGADQSEEEWDPEYAKDDDAEGWS